MHNVLCVKCSQWFWHHLCCWTIVTSGTGDTRKVLVRIFYSFPCVPCPCRTWTLCTNTDFGITCLSLLPEGESGGLWEWLCWCCVCQSQGQTPCASEVLLPAQTPRHRAVFCWPWVTLAEMSAEPALALSAFTVSCKVNQMLLCDDKCYSCKSSWRRLSIRPVQKQTMSVLLKLCSVCGAPGSCAAPRGSSGKMLWVSSETFPVFNRKRLLLLYWVELNFWPHLRVSHSELGEAMSCTL